MAIRIIITGGTFDKEYDPVQGKLTFRETHMLEMLKTVRCSVPVELEVNQLIDSLDMRKTNRRSILDSCIRSAQDRIVITHGTDTMIETAKLLGNAHLDKTVILTGAMVPYSISGSDAEFNLGCSMIAAQLLPTGVYITMNGRVFAWDNVKKNKQTGTFEQQ